MLPHSRMCLNFQAHACIQHFSQCYSSLPYLSSYPLVFLLSIVHTHTHARAQAHTRTHSPQTLTHAPLSSKGSVAYKLAAVSSQSLCRGRQDKLLRLDGTELNQASLDWTILGWGFLQENHLWFLFLFFPRTGLQWTELVELNSCWAWCHWTVFKFASRPRGRGVE